MTKEDTQVDRVEPPADDVTTILRSVDDVGKNVLLIARSLLNVTTNSIGTVQERLHDLLDQLELDKVLEDKYEGVELAVRGAFDELLRSNVDEYFPRPYQSRDPRTLEDERRVWPSWPAPGFGFFGGARTPFGYRARAPTEATYGDCIAKQGESVWDQDGWWRCLFPDAAVAPEFLKLKQTRFGDKVLTKDDFDAARLQHQVEPTALVFDLGSKGVFFRHLTDYLDWKRHKRAGWPREAAVPDAVEAAADATAESAVNTPTPSMVSVSVSLSYNLDDRNEVLKEVRHELLSDGTANTTRITKKRAPDSTEWVTVDESSELTPGKGKGWFWNKE
jgi:hypothetical protein